MFNNKSVNMAFQLRNVFDLACFLKCIYTELWEALSIFEIAQTCCNKPLKLRKPLITVVRK